MIDLLVIPIVALLILWLALTVAWKIVRWLWKHLITIPRTNRHFVRGFRKQPPMSKSDFRNYPAFKNIAIRLKHLGYARGKAERGVIAFLFTRKYRGFRAHKRFLVMHSGSDAFLMTPCRYWALTNGYYSAGRIDALQIRVITYRKKTPNRPTESEDVLEQTWEYTTKAGQADLRYKDNEIFFIIRRYGVTLYLQDNQVWCLTDLSQRKCAVAIACFVKLSGADPIDEGDSWTKNRSKPEQDDDNSEESADDGQEEPEAANTIASGNRPWYQVLGVDPDATREEIVAARNKRVHELHPDRLKSIDGLSPEIERFANEKMAEVNVAYAEAIRLRSAKQA